jgi:hypothetical protein
VGSLLVAETKDVRLRAFITMISNYKS